MQTNVRVSGEINVRVTGRRVGGEANVRVSGSRLSGRKVSSLNQCEGEQ